VISLFPHENAMSLFPHEDAMSLFPHEDVKPLVPIDDVDTIGWVFTNKYMNMPPNMIKHMTTPNQSITRTWRVT